MCRQAILQFCFLPSWWPRSSVKSPNGIRVSFLHSQSLITLHVQTYHVRLILLLILRCLHLLRSSYGFRLDWKATPTGVHPDASPCFHLFLKKCSTMWTKTVVQGKLHCLYFPCFPPPWPIILKDLKLTEKEKKKTLNYPNYTSRGCVNFDPESNQNHRLHLIVISLQSPLAYSSAPIFFFLPGHL